MRDDRESAAGSRAARARALRARREAEGRARVLTLDGRDVTTEFVAGARVVADRASDAGATHAVLQSRSPSCGCGRIYDGTHSGRLVDGDGVLAALLLRRGVAVESRRGSSEPGLAS